MSKYKYNDYDESLITPYKSKRRKKKTVKSNHKHKYEKIICKYYMNEREQYCLADKCLICGKINNYKLFLDIKIESGSGCRKMFPDLDDLKKAYPSLKIIDVEKLW